LVHFLAAGLGLFVLFGIVNRDEPDADPNVVTVDHDALLTFVQYRIKAFNPTLAEEKLSSLSDEELQNLIDDYVREEVLHREAVALGLGEDDYVIRRRLVQKLEFITEGFAEAGAKVDRAALQRYFDANKADYYVEPFVTFTHVFFETEDRPREQAHAVAEKKLLELNRNGVAFADAPQHGDRFLYHVNYVERTPDYVASHFGVPMAKAVFELEPNDFIWRGPFDSPYGVHLVLLTINEPGRDPELAELEGRVRVDAQRAMIREETEAAIADIVGSYEVRVVYERDDAAEPDAESAANR
ncbi:MAG: peptidyl-prolyl cis-trans isomerase, partial [Deltaproteobacteria bacterium]|nr:peptidyl-prolyl cis-trans isomerase [Deltaproteobacteria bacterium]